MAKKISASEAVPVAAPVKARKTIAAAETSALSPTRLRLGVSGFRFKLSGFRRPAFGKNTKFAKTPEKRPQSLKTLTWFFLN